MPDLQIVAHHADFGPLIEPILQSVSEITGYQTTLFYDVIDLDPYLDHNRAQYNAAGLIDHYEAHMKADKNIIITDVDIFIPIFTHVFGLARLNGRLAIVSIHRLMPEFYGLPADPDWLSQRLKKEIIHEFGHLANLRHCNNFRCVMASSNTADDLDVKAEYFCDNCRVLIEK